jgi:hypothetical protein
MTDLLRGPLVCILELCHAASKISGEGDCWNRVMKEAEEVRRAACLQYNRQELFQHLSSARLALNYVYSRRREVRHRRG